MPASVFKRQKELPSFPCLKNSLQLRVVNMKDSRLDFATSLAKTKTSLAKRKNGLQNEKIAKRKKRKKK